MKEDNQDSIVEALDTERKILEAAEREFLSKGYVAARTTAIAEAAGVTHAMLHYYYRTKENLFSKVISGKIRSLADAFIVKFEDGESSLEECLRQGIESHFDFVWENPELPRFMVCEVFQNPDLMDRLKERFQETSGRIISRLQMKIDSEAEGGRCRKVEAREIMIDIISLNVFPALTAHMFDRVFGDNMAEVLEMRKRSNIDTILRKMEII